MTKLKVGTGWGKVDFPTALGRSVAGDIIEVDPGHYDLGRHELHGVTIRGAAAAGSAVLTGKIAPRGHCRLEGVELRSLPYDNAIGMLDDDAFLNVADCTIVGDPAARFPAVWGNHGTLILERAMVRSDPEQHGVQIAAGARLHATASHLDRFWISGGHADLIDTAATQLEARGGARVATYGTFTLAPSEGQRAFTATEQSACQFPRLAVTDAAPPAEAIADDSLVQIDVLVDSTTLTVISQNNAKVRTDSPGVLVREASESRDAAASPPHDVPAPHTAPEPRFVRWPLEHAHAFSSVIAPQVRAGDTILLDEGEYFLDEYADDSVQLNANILGQGRREHTVIHGTIAALAQGTVSISNVTIRAASPAQQAVNVTAPDSTASLHNVILEANHDAATAPVFYALGTTVSMTGSVIAARSDARVGALTLHEGASLQASDSELGWLTVDQGSTAELDGCYSLGAEAGGGSVVSVTHSHFIRGNTCDQYDLSLDGGSSITIPSLATDAPELGVYAVEGSLHVDVFHSDAQAAYSVYRSGDAPVQISGTAYELHALDSAEPVPATTGGGEASGAGSGAPAAADSLSGADPSEASDLDIFGLFFGRPAGPTAPGATDAESGPEPGPVPPAATTVDAEGPAVSQGEDSALTELNSLIGLAQVKQQVQSFIDTVKLRQRRAELGLPADDAFTLHSMFLGNPGTGKTTVAKLLGKALHQVGVVPTDGFTLATKADLISDSVGGSGAKTRAVLEGALGGVLLIDEAYTLADQDSAGFAAEVVGELIAFMEEHRGDTMVILAGYTDKMHALLAVNEGMRSRIKHRFDFEDYSPGEVAEIGLRELERGQYAVDEPLYRRVVAGAYAQATSRDNGRWIRNFNQDLRAELDKRVIALPDPTREDLTAVLDVDLFALAGGDPAERSGKLDGLLAELDAMIGLDPVKQWVRSLVNQAKVNQRMLEHDGSVERPSYHMAFLGSPGTGKTTVARIVAEIFHALGILPTPNVKETKPTSLVGKYIGHTEDETDLVLDEAMGGVLFVDEAHQLYAGDGRNDFGEKVIQTLLPRLENDRGRFVAIFAGYTDQMRTLYQADPGLKSRIPLEIVFPDYSSAEVAEIASLILAKRWEFNAALFAEIAGATYDALPEDERDNGRWARNFTSRVVAAHTDYLAENDVTGAEMRRIPDAILRSFAPPTTP